MTYEQSNGFGRQPLRNASPTFEPHYGDPKKMGIFGAPACRCTTLVLALCLALSGLVVCGVGGVIAGFMWADETPKSLGMALVGLGILMMVGGFGLYMWDSYNFPPGSQYRQTNGPQQTQIVNTIQQSSPPIATITTTTTQLNRQAPPPQVAGASAPRGSEAPPPYDDVMNSSVEYRQKPTGSVPATAVVRPSYQSAVVGNARITSTTAV